CLLFAVCYCWIAVDVRCEEKRIRLFDLDFKTTRYFPRRADYSSAFHRRTDVF
ncbi:MAG: hypothetical protein ACI8RD_013494, partial [Bacillariaceae sp.]